MSQNSPQENGRGGDGAGQWVMLQESFSRQMIRLRFERQTIEKEGLKLNTIVVFKIELKCTCVIIRNDLNCDNEVKKYQYVADGRRFFRVQLSCESVGLRHLSPLVKTRRSHTYRRQTILFFNAQGSKHVHRQQSYWHTQTKGYTATTLISLCCPSH